MVVARPPSSRNPVESLVHNGLDKPDIENLERALPQRRLTRSSADAGHLSEPLAVINEARELEEPWELDSPCSFPARGMPSLFSQSQQTT